MLQWSIVQLSVYLSGGLTPATETDLLPVSLRGGGHLTLRYNTRNLRDCQNYLYKEQKMSRAGYRYIPAYRRGTSLLRSISFFIQTEKAWENAPSYIPGPSRIHISTCLPLHLSNVPTEAKDATVCSMLLPGYRFILSLCHGIQLPDLVHVLLDRTVGRELACAGRIHHSHARPSLVIAISLLNSLLRFRV